MRQNTADLLNLYQTDLEARANRAQLRVQRGEHWFEVATSEHNADTELTDSSKSIYTVFTQFDKFHTSDVFVLDAALVAWKLFQFIHDCILRVIFAKPHNDI